MLLLYRKRDERIDIEKDGVVLGTILVAKITSTKVRLGLTFPDDHIISRDNAKTRGRSENANTRTETGQSE